MSSELDEWLSDSENVTAPSRGNRVYQPKNWALTDRVATSVHHLGYHSMISGMLTLNFIIFNESTNLFFYVAILSIIVASILLLPRIFLRNNRAFMRERETMSRVEEGMETAIFKQWLDLFPLNITPLLLFINFARFSAVVLFMFFIINALFRLFGKY